MKRFSKQQQDDLQKLLDELASAKMDFETEWSKLDDQLGHVNSAIETYNGLLENITSWRDEAVAEMENYYDERSEKWQESDAASYFTEWKDEWGNVSLDPVDEIELPDEPSLSHADEIEALPQEPSS